MQKYTRMRDERNSGGPRLSMCIDAGSAEEANEIFEERWRQKVGEARGGDAGGSSITKAVMRGPMVFRGKVTVR